MTNIHRPRRNEQIDFNSGNRLPYEDCTVLGVEETKLEILEACSFIKMIPIMQQIFLAQ